MKEVGLSFQLSDWTLWRATLKLQSVQFGLADAPPPTADPLPPDFGLEPGSSGYMLRSLPVDGDVPEFTHIGGFIRYVPLQYRHSYIDMAGDFEAYRLKFSSKTRATINRKVRRFAETCGGELRWACYRTPAELEAFFPLARAVSVRTYQERLLDAGLPDNAEYQSRMVEAAAQDRVRAFLLFHGDRPVSYLFCPAEHRVLIYAYLGYDPEYQKLSVGTVLQWLALEQLFVERRFDYFDFTEGQSEHKRLFATHERRCANVLFVRRTFANTLLIRGHSAFNGIGAGFGALLDRWGLKDRVRRLVRSAA